MAITTSPHDAAELASLQPCGLPADPSLLARHMDRCVAAAVGLGLTVGTALAVHGAVTERFGADLARADRELVRALTRLLGLA